MNDRCWRAILCPARAEIGCRSPIRRQVTVPGTRHERDEGMGLPRRPARCPAGGRLVPGCRVGDVAQDPLPGGRDRLPDLFQGSGLEGRPLTFDHDGTYALQLVHVDDVAAGLLAIYDAPELLAQPPASAAGRAFNITGGTCIRVLELAALVTAACPSADIRFTPGRAMAADQQALFSLSALRSLGWQPRVALDAGIARYAAWLARHSF